jgi:hypothetical protein
MSRLPRRGRDGARYDRERRVRRWLRERTVSYLSGSGYTLTVVLNFKDGGMVGFASNDKQWFPVKGTCETVA